MQDLNNLKSSYNLIPDKARLELLQIENYQLRSAAINYLKMYREISDEYNYKMLSAAQISSFWSNNSLISFSVDLSNAVSGTGWHKPEIDGTWTGPELVSEILLPPIPAGVYLLTVLIRDLLNIEDAPGIKIEIHALETGGKVLCSALNFSNTDCMLPVELYSKIELPRISNWWKIKILTPSARFPGEKNPDDIRKIGAKISKIKFSNLI